MNEKKEDKKMRKNDRRVLISIAACGVLLNGCAFITGNEENEAVTIDKVTTKTLSNGDTEVTITYTDEREPTVFTIPKGNEGKAGNGISDITSKKNDDGSLNVVVSFTDVKKDPVTFTIPTGNGIKDVTSSVDKDGNTLLNISYTDGRDNQVFSLGKPKDGRGIKEISVESTDLDKGTATLLVNFSDGTSQELTLQLGRGVSYASGTTDEEGNNVITFVYTDGNESEPIVLERGNTWFSGVQPLSDLNSQGIGKDGDFYYNTSEQSIYKKEEGVWTSIFTLPSSDHEWKVTFDLNKDIELNDGTKVSGAGFNDNSDSSKKVKNGTSFSESEISVPEPHADNATFLGWYTTKEKKTNAGKFTDLTIINEDVTFYAWWEKKNITHEVTFNLNDEGVSNAHFAKGTEDKVTIGEGSSFYSAGLSLPLPTSDDADFMGWYVTSVTNVNSGQFTDLSEVTTDLVLYAKWSKKNSA